MRKLIEHCPGCGGHLTVSRLDCSQCHTRVEGAFQPSAFDSLSPESLAFVELFVRLKGNMKEMERELSLAYSTVRHRLDEVVRELGAPRTTPEAPPATSDDAAPTERKREILNRLEQGEITPAEAVQLLGGE
jgi:hypothetical protein